MFKVGDRVVSKVDPDHKGSITKMKYVPAKGLTQKEYWWLYLDGSAYPSGTSDDFIQALNESKTS